MTDDKLTASEQILAQQAQIDQLTAALAATQQAVQPPGPNPGSTATMEYFGDTAALYTALAEAQGNFDTPKKSKTGRTGNQTYKYADLSDLIGASRKALADAGIAFAQPICSSPMVEGWHRLTTILGGHGGEIRVHTDFDPALKVDSDDRGDLKTYGKRTTYLRRYALQALLGLDGESDADSDPDSLKGPSGGRRPNGQQRNRQAPGKGSKAPKKAKEEEPPPPSDEDRPPAGEVPPPDREPPAVTEAPTQPVGEPEAHAGDVMATDEQVSRLKSLCVDKKIGGPQAVKLSVEVGGAPPDKLTASQADKLIAHLEGL